MRAAIALALSIIGIPFAWQHLKLAGLALSPIGTAIESSGVADAARRENDWHAMMAERSY